MKCPFCGHLGDKVVDSRESKEGEVIRRRRECLDCGRRFTSYERIDESWRRIDGAQYGVASRLAMQLDSLTNNISLALAFRLDATTTLLFPGDAQIGNWKSWGDQKYSVEGREIDVSDLMRNVRVYKVGHHASHNGTCRPERFDRMPSGMKSFRHDRSAECLGITRPPDDDSGGIGCVVDYSRYKKFFRHVKEIFNFCRRRHDIHRRVGIHEAGTGDWAGDPGHRRHQKQDEGKNHF